MTIEKPEYTGDGILNAPVEYLEQLKKALTNNYAEIYLELEVATIIHLLSFKQKMKPTTMKIEQYVQVFQQLKQGVSSAAIAKSLGISSTRVNQLKTNKEKGICGAICSALSLLTEQRKMAISSSQIPQGYILHSIPDRNRVTAIHPVNSLWEYLKHYATPIGGVFTPRNKNKFTQFRLRLGEIDDYCVDDIFFYVNRGRGLQPTRKIADDCSVSFILYLGDTTFCLEYHTYLLLQICQLHGLKKKDRITKEYPLTNDGFYDAINELNQKIKDLCARCRWDYDEASGKIMFFFDGQLISGGDS